MLLPVLLRGYQRVQTLPADHHDGIRRSAILLGCVNSADGSARHDTIRSAVARSPAAYGESTS